MNSFIKLTLLFLCFWLFACQAPDNNTLPLLGKPEISNRDTIFPKIKPFRFINQDSLIVSDKDFQNKIYIANFIFLSCPSICPKMTKQMLRVYNTYYDNQYLMMISHTIDPEHDKVSLLNTYANNLKISSKKWYFVTGKKDSIYNLAKESYFSTAYADKKAPGGYVHSGGLLLIDKNKHIRGVYDGTNEAETDRLISDIALLLKEQFN